LFGYVADKELGFYLGSEQARFSVLARWQPFREGACSKVQKKGRTRNCKYLHQFLAVSLDVGDVYVLWTLLHSNFFYLKLW